MTTCTAKSVVKSQPGICVSYMTGSGIEGVQLNVFRSYPVKDQKTGFNCKFLYADNHKRMFKTRQECDKFCLERGYTQPYYHKSWKYIK